MPAACPRCAAVDGLAPSSTGGATCSACGLVLTADQVGEARYLEQVERWAADRRAWLVGVAAAPAGTIAAPVPGPGATAQHTTGSRAQGCLLSAGAFALVAAGIVFVSVAWGSLSDVGRFAVLLLAGVLALAVAWVSAPRIRASATTLAIAGALLCVVASAFLALQDAPSSAAPRLLLATAVGVGLIAFGRRAAARLRVGAVVSALAGAGLLLIAWLALPSSADLDLGDRESLWVAGVLVVWGLALLGWSVVDRTLSWSWPAMVGLVAAAGAAADAVVVTGVDARPDEPRTLLPVLVLLAGSAVLLGLDRVAALRHRALVVGAVVLHVLALLSLLATVSRPGLRPWAALVLVVWAASWAALVAHARAHHADEARALDAAVPWVAGTTSALALALLGASWRVLPDSLPSLLEDVVADAYPWWRGAVVGAVACVVAGVVVQLRRRATDVEAGWQRQVGDALVLVWPLLVLAVWCGIAFGDAARSFGPDGPNDAITGAVAAALLVTGFGLVALAAASRVPWVLWAGGATAVVGVQVAWSLLDTADWSVAPEVQGLLLAAPLVLAGAIHVLLAGDRAVPTLATVAPGLTALLLPPTVAVLDATAQRWFSGLFDTADQPTTAALVRSVALTLVAAALAVVGARNRWAGVFWPGLVVLVVVVGAQVVDLADRLPPWISLAVVGVVLVVAGARWESVRARGRRTRQWAGALR